MGRKSDKPHQIRTQSSPYLDAGRLDMIHESFEQYGGVRSKRSFAFFAVMRAEFAAPPGAPNRLREAMHEHQLKVADLGKALGITLAEAAMLHAVGHDLSARELLVIVARVRRFAEENPKPTPLLVADSGCGCMGRPPAPARCAHIAMIIRASRSHSRARRKRMRSAQLRLLFQAPHSTPAGPPRDTST